MLVIGQFSDILHSQVSCFSVSDSLTLRFCRQFVLYSGNKNIQFHVSSNRIPNYPAFADDHFCTSRVVK